MKFIFFVLIGLITPPAIWSGNFNETAKIAKESNKLILINFSGSDWCGPCIRLKNEIFATEVFEKFASEKLLLVRADFPRQKKNKLPETQVNLNEILAERYNKDGKFPFTLLVNSEGKILKTWDGLPKENAAQFVKQLELLSQKR
jgi:thiol-disulfide isomerase/thioredoxin